MRGLDLVRRLSATPPFGTDVLTLIDVPRPVSGAMLIALFLGVASRPFYHPAGTCRARTAVRSSHPIFECGAEALWVVDASILSTHIAGNANASVLMIGETAADLIRAAL